MTGSSEKMGNLITTEEAAAILGVTKRHVRRLAQAGKIEGVYLSGVWVINRDSLDGWTRSVAGRKPKGGTREQ